MAFPTSVNSQITDAVTQTNVKVLGDSPAMALGDLYQATAQALSNAAHNATAAQQQASAASQASTTQGVATLYAIDTAAAGRATQQLFGAAILTGPGVTPEHLNKLQQDPSQLLYLGNTSLSQDHIDELVRLEHLQALHLDSVDVSAEQLARLAEALPNTAIVRTPQAY